MATGNSTPIPPRAKDLTGQTFGKWTVIGFHSRSKSRTMWICQCECGIEKRIGGGDLCNGKSRSCHSCARRTHGLTRTPEYRVWANMLDRCRNPASPGYVRWGGRGIVVCERWQSFENFLEDMGKRPSPEHSIERRDNDLGYSPENCYWATLKEQSHNKRNTQLLTFRDRTMCLAAWAEELGIAYDTLRGRLRYGWSVDRALTTPVHVHKRRD